MSEQKLDNTLWVERYGDQMYRFTLVRVKDSDAAEDIVQSAFIAGLQAQKTFAGRSSEKSWLFGILKHKIMDHFREIKKTVSYDLSESDDSAPPQFNASGHFLNMPKNWDLSPEKAAENQELAQALLFCMDGLSDKFRRIFVLKEIEGLSSEEICNEFDIQPTNLWVILHRARNRLKQCLEARWFQDPQ